MNQNFIQLVEPCNEIYLGWQQNKKARNDDYHEISSPLEPLFDFIYVPQTLVESESQTSQNFIDVSQFIHNTPQNIDLVEFDKGSNVLHPIRLHANSTQESSNSKTNDLLQTNEVFAFIDGEETLIQNNENQRTNIFFQLTLKKKPNRSRKYVSQTPFYLDKLGKTVKLQIEFRLSLEEMHRILHNRILFFSLSRCDFPTDKIVSDAEIFLCWGDKCCKPIRRRRHHHHHQEQQNYPINQNEESGGITPTQYSCKNEERGSCLSKNIDSLDSNKVVLFLKSEFKGPFERTTHVKPKYQFSICIDLDVVFQTIIEPQSHKYESSTFITDSRSAPPFHETFFTI